jgi:putative flavoprotein involved in K+ transport
MKADNVVIATGLFQQPKVPAMSADLASSITQLHSGQYRNPDALPPGAVLVVGSGQSGCQIAEELYRSGRRVYLCVGSTGRAPRRYRGKDAFAWLELCGFFSRTVDKLPSPKAKFGGNPHLTGRDGGHSLNLHQFKRDGVVLLGHLAGIHDQTISLAPDLNESLAKCDGFEAELVRIIDAYIVDHGLDSPPETLPSLRDGYAGELITELDLTAEGITTVIWAIGYRYDFSIIKLPVTDSDGFPITRRGETDFPGLYFVGMPWLHTQKSGLLLGVGEDAAIIASSIAERMASKGPSSA